MTLEQQVTSLEISKRLKELGVKQESLYWYNQLSNNPNGTEHFLLEHFYMTTAIENYSAFTVAELGEMLPDQVNGFDLRIEKCTSSREKKTTWSIAYYEIGYEDELRFEMQVADTEADARGKMLIYLLENKLI